MKRREAWFESQLDLDPQKLVFIDETWTTTNMARKCGRAPKGERLRAGIPHGHWKTTTFVAGLRLTGIVAPMVLDRPIDGVWFQAYVEHVLVPTLSPGDIVIMDNLGSHKGACVRKAIEAKARSFSIFRPTAPTSIRSKTPSRNSRRYCAKPPSEPSIPSGKGSAPCSLSSPLKSAQTSSPQQVMSRFKAYPL